MNLLPWFAFASTVSVILRRNRPAADFAETINGGDVYIL